MKLKQLDAKFIQFREEGAGLSSFVTTLKFEAAMGVSFLCPKCFTKNKGPRDTHTIECWFNGRGVPDKVAPAPARWNADGSGLDDLTFVGPGPVSVIRIGGCNAHFVVKKGDIINS